MNARIAVLGSLNMDFVVRVERLPAPGETVLGRDFQMLPGGKGANQACAAGKLGGLSVRTSMLGRVGLDVFGEQLKASLAAAGMDVSGVKGIPEQPTGTAFIWVDGAGQNSIVVASGANFKFAADDVDELRGVFAASAYVLFQLETPVMTVGAALALARAAGARTILDPAPVQMLPREMTELVDVLTPNETEAGGLLGRGLGRVSMSEAPELARALREQCGCGAVVLKLGEQGCFYCDGQQEFGVPGFAVTVRDTTAAGDTFNAGLAVGLAEGMEIRAALRFANAAAAISVTRLGAQASAPGREEVEELVRRGGF